MKQCNECAHFQVKNARCHAPAGDRHTGAIYARGDFGICKEEARLFRPKNEAPPEPIKATITPVVREEVPADLPAPNRKLHKVEPANLVDDDFDEEDAEDILAEATAAAEERNTALTRRAEWSAMNSDKKRDALIAWEVTDKSKSALKKLKVADLDNMLEDYYTT